VIFQRAKVVGFDPGQAAIPPSVRGRPRRLL